MEKYHGPGIGIGIGVGIGISSQEDELKAGGESACQASQYH